MPHAPQSCPRAIIIGGGPAGLMAAETLLAGGIQVDLYDAMPSVGRKFLLAGVGGMNITHSEEVGRFLSRYGAALPRLAPSLQAFGADALRDWVHGLGIETFVGSSGKVFPSGMKAAPLLRAWLARLRDSGLRLHPRHRWTGWTDAGELAFDTPDGPISTRADAVVLALGGGSWKKLGSDGRWMPLLAAQHVPLSPLQPANCGFIGQWSPVFADKFAGHPLKNVVLQCEDTSGTSHQRRGEMVITRDGVEGNLVYAFGALLRDRLLRDGHATFTLDLLPDRSADWVRQALDKGRGTASLSNHLRKQCGLDGVRAGLLRECLDKEAFQDMARLAAGIKQLPVTVHATRPIDEAISTAGGVRFDGLDDQLMLTALPGVFCAGEMLDWEAPTGGYLLTACFATGKTAGQGAVAWLRSRPHSELC